MSIDSPPLFVLLLLASSIGAGACCHPPRSSSDAGRRLDAGQRSGACARWSAPTPLGTFAVQPSLSEISGLAVSARDPDLLWVHNDSGDAPRLYALSRGGALRATFELEGVRALDWEDLARGPCPASLDLGAGRSCLFVGDIGDNRAAYPQRALHILLEPEIVAGADPATPRLITPAASITLRYADGPRDAEGLVVDPRGQPFVLTKGREGLPAVYRLDGPIAPGASLTLRRIFTFAPDDLDPSSPLLTAADLGPRGERLLLRTYASLLLLTLPPAPAPRLSAESLGTGSIQALPVATEPQGEAIAWEPDARAYLSVSEQVGTISRVACAD